MADSPSSDDASLAAVKAALATRKEITDPAALLEAIGRKVQAKAAFRSKK